MVSKSQCHMSIAAWRDVVKIVGEWKKMWNIILLVLPCAQLTVWLVVGRYLNLLIVALSLILSNLAATSFINMLPTYFHFNSHKPFSNTPSQSPHSHYPRQNDNIITAQVTILHTSSTTNIPTVHTFTIIHNNHHTFHISISLKVQWLVKFII